MFQKKLSQIKVGAIISYISIAFSVIAGLLYTPWMISQIGQSDYGLYVLASSLISFFLIDFGLGAATARFVAKYKVEENQVKLDEFISALYKLYFMIDALILVVLIVIYLAIDQIYGNLSAVELERLRVIYCIAGVYSIISFPCVTFNGILTAYEEFIPLKLADLCQKVGAVVFTIAALLIGKGLYALVLINSITGLLSITVKYFYVRKKVSIKFIGNKKETYKEIFGFSIWSTVGGISQRLIFNITPTILGMVVRKATSAIAVFGIVSAIEGYFYTITSAINGMFLSRITKITQKENHEEEITSLAIKIGRFQFALSGLIAVGFILVGKEFIFLWMGEAYIQAYYGIIFTILPGLFYNSLQIANTTLIVNDFIKYQAYIQIVTGVCNIIISPILSYHWGVLGATFSIFISYTIRVILLIVLVDRKLEIDMRKFVSECYIKMSMPILISGIIGGLILLTFDSMSWSVLVIKIAIVTGIYGISIFCFGLSGNERKKAKYFVMKKSSR